MSHMFTKTTIAGLINRKTSLIYEYTWLDSLLQGINSTWFTKSSIGDELWDQLRQAIEELERLRTFAICTAGSHGKQDVWKIRWYVRRERRKNLPYPIDVCCDFEDALLEVTGEIRRASKKRFGIGKKRKMDNKWLSQAVFKLRDIMGAFRPRILEAYAYLCTHFALELIQGGVSKSTRDSLWKELFSSVYGDLTNLLLYPHEHGVKAGRLPVSVWHPVKVPLEALLKIHASLISFVDHILPPDTIVPTTKCNALLSHFGSVFVRAAYFSYSWWWVWTDNQNDDNDKDDQMDHNKKLDNLYDDCDDKNDQMDNKKSSEEMIILDLLKQVMPKIPEDIDLCIQVLRASTSFSKSSQTKDVAGHLVQLLIPEADGHQLVTAFRKGLAWLITFLIDAPDLYDDGDGDRVKLLLWDVTMVACEFGSISYLFYLTQDKAKETVETLVKLLEKMELLEVQLLMVELLKLVDLETMLTQHKSFEDLKYLKVVT